MKHFDRKEMDSTSSLSWNLSSKPIITLKGRLMEKKDNQGVEEHTNGQHT
jgi:hypothetical protein